MILINGVLGVKIMCSLKVVDFVITVKIALLTD